MARARCLAISRLPVRATGCRSLSMLLRTVVYERGPARCGRCTLMKLHFTVVAKATRLRAERS